MSIDKALTVPVSAVFPLPAESGDNAGNGAATGERDAVFVVEGGRARLRPVQIGARNGSRAWVRSGLDASARVIVYPGAAVTDGVRVQARKV
jgi:HlyD family secretion protein